MATASHNPRTKKVRSQKWPLAVAVILVFIALLTALVFLNSRRTKSSVVVSTYNNTALDGCAGFVLKNGEKINTFCFWTKPEDQALIDGTIRVGDTVEYGTKEGKPFVRLKDR